MKSLVYVIAGLVSSQPMMERVSMSMNVPLKTIVQILVKGFKHIPMDIDPDQIMSRSPWLNPKKVFV